MAIFRNLLIFFLIIETTLGTFGIIREWEDYKLKYGKNYDRTENIRRKSIYITNKYWIQAHNLRFDRGCETYELGINQFTDMRYAEFAGIFVEGNSLKPGGSPFPPRGLCNNRNDNNQPWDNYDWINFGAVSPIRQQGIRCNAGWAFASLSALEGRHFVTQGTLPPELSPQNLIDCVPEASCTTIKTPADAYGYIEQNQNVNTEANYPYQGITNGQCRYNPNDLGATIADFIVLNRTVNEMEFQDTVRYGGPVAFEFDPLSFTFMHYKSGVYRPAANTFAPRGKHYMTIVGFGNDVQGGNYWLVKNSFGTTWGESGYMRLQSNAVRSITYPIV